MKVLRKKPGESWELIEIENKLKALQDEVGGYIEAVTIALDACLIVNEEGQLLHLEHNLDFLGLRLYGPVLIVGTRGEEFCSIPDYALQIVDSVKQKEAR